MLKQQATNLSSIKLILALQRKSVMLEATLYSHIVASNINKICTIIINSVYNLLLQPHTQQEPGCLEVTRSLKAAEPGVILPREIQNCLLVWIANTTVLSII